MKIALYNLTTTTKSGGIETFNWEMANALAKKGHTVHIYGGRGDMIDVAPSNVLILTYPYLRRELIPNLGSRFRKFVERVSFAIFAFKGLVKKGYDFICVSKPFDIPIALLASKFSHAKVIFCSGGTEFFPGYKCLVKKVDYFFSCSNFNANQIFEYCKIKPLTLPYGINTELFKPLNPDISLRQGLKIGDNEIVIITACRLVGWKGIQYSIRGIGLLIKKGYNIKYLIIGDGEDRERLKTIAKDLGISESVYFLGDIKNSELPRYYSIAHAAVFPSIANETFGISIAEAMSCGIPVVSTKIGGIPEVVADGTGFLVQPEDEDALAESIEKIITNSELKENLGCSGRKWVIENFNWDKIVEKFEGYINHV